MATGKRVENFTVTEKRMLSEILRDFPIIENKSYEKEILLEKTKAWEEVTKLFNSNFPQRLPRDDKALKGAWRRLKIKAKESIGDKMKETKRSEIGPPSPLMSIEENVAAMFGDSTNPMNCGFDNDVTLVGVPVLEDGDVMLSTEYVEKDEEMLDLTNIIYNKQLEVLELKKKKNEEKIKFQRLEFEEKMAHNRKKAKLELFILQEEARQKGITIPKDLL